MSLLNGRMKQKEVNLTTLVQRLRDNLLFELADNVNLFGYFRHFSVFSCQSWGSLGSEIGSWRRDKNFPQTKTVCNCWNGTSC